MTDRTVTANGIDSGLLEAGSGPLALCLYGFPDSAHTWRHLLPRLAAARFHAVAPFMRGDAPTGIPPDGCYHVGALVADAVALHEVAGRRRGCGADRARLGSRGGLRRRRVRTEGRPRIVTLAVPTAALDEELFADYDQLKRFFYLFLLKTPLAEAVVAVEDMAFLDRLCAHWSPGYDAGEDLRHAKRCLRDGRNLAGALGYYRAESGVEVPPGAEYGA